MLFRSSFDSVTASRVCSVWFTRMMRWPFDRQRSNGQLLGLSVLKSEIISGCILSYRLTARTYVGFLHKVKRPGGQHRARASSTTSTVAGLDQRLHSMMDSTPVVCRRLNLFQSNHKRGQHASSWSTPTFLFA